MSQYEEQILKKHCILAVGPYYHEKYASIIYTPEEKFYSPYKVNDIIELFCLLHGSSLAGRKLSSRKRSKDVKNPSILISQLNSIAAYQVPCENNLDTIWIMDVENSMVGSLPNNKSEIILSNQVKLQSALAANLVEKRKLKALNLLYENAYTFVQSHFFNKVAK
ncbi:competence protein ComK [Ureibacillus chungkukjangi]|uniref:competence protein ComK n=1 Tax=Ureibacillus chungkukjangi TaxID=1202712 RepID=UPI0020413A50|nr:competence protein ComK [Ureibacillus chungkukjangi]MCM3386863.1 competence protein ComK [Ureibacillus chungkukjangi]